MQEYLLVAQKNSKDEIVDKYNNDVESFSGRFSEKMENILVNRLGVKSLAKN